MIIDVLVAAESVLLRPMRRAARDKVGRLIVAEAGEDRIFAGKVVVQADVPGTFIQLPHWLVDVVVIRLRSRSAWGKAEELSVPTGINISAPE